jgi:hypothetical protein
MHPLVKNVEYAVRGALPIRAEALSAVRFKTFMFSKNKKLTNKKNMILAIKERSFKVEL